MRWARIIIRKTDILPSFFLYIYYFYTHVHVRNIFAVYIIVEKACYDTRIMFCVYVRQKFLKSSYSWYDKLYVYMHVCMYNNYMRSRKICTCDATNESQYIFYRTRYANIFRQMNQHMFFSLFVSQTRAFCWIEDHV